MRKLVLLSALCVLVAVCLSDGAAASVLDRAMRLTESGDTVKVTRLLRDHPVLAEARGRHCETLLDVAAKYGRMEIARALIRKGADVNATQAGDWTPLHYAAGDGHPQMVRLLLEHGAKVNARTDMGATALHMAAGMNYREIVSLLIAKGADVNAKDAAGYPPLHKAAEGDCVDATKLLIQKGADMSAKDKQGETSLSLAEREGHTAVAALLRHGKPGK